MTVWNMAQIQQAYRDAYQKYLDSNPGLSGNPETDSELLKNLNQLKADHPDLVPQFNLTEARLNAAATVYHHLSTLKGSEKQIALAENIKENVESTILFAIEQGKREQGNPKAQAAVSFLTDKLERLNTAEYAGDIIDLFKHINFTGDRMEDFRWIMAVYRTSVPMSVGQEKILDKKAK